MKYRKAVFVLPYVKTKEGIRYLLLKRKLHWNGWEFTKGGINHGEAKEKAVKRELREETGLHALKIKRFPYSGKYIYNKRFPTRPGMIGQTFSLYSAEVKKGKVRADKKEHSGHRWEDFSHAMKILRWPNQRKSLKIVNASLMHEVSRV